MIRVSPGGEDRDADGVRGYWDVIILGPCVDDAVINCIDVGEGGYFSVQYGVETILSDKFG